jgi:ActR/RegA family two-component response regulator
MTIGDNLLIVEDDDDWSAIYRRAARSEGLTTVRVAKDLSQLDDALREMTFAVALVDIGLDVADDRNVDGLLALERVRKLGDDTSLIVVTGRSGRDVLPITRDALKKYEAFDAISKVPVEPDELRRLIKAGLEEYRRVVSRKGPRVSEVLRGTTPATIWNWKMLRELQIRGGITALYDLLEKLVSDFLPVLKPQRDEVVTIDSDRSLAHGELWSRAYGHGVVVCFGDQHEVRRLLDGLSAGTAVVGGHKPSEVLNDKLVGSMRGLVLAVPALQRDYFV